MKKLMVRRIGIISTIKVRSLSLRLDFQLDPNDLQKLRTEIKTNLAENQSVTNLRTVQSRVDNKNKKKTFDSKKLKRNNKAEKSHQSSSKGKPGKLGKSGAIELDFDLNI